MIIINVRLSKKKLASKKIRYIRIRRSGDKFGFGRRARLLLGKRIAKELPNRLVEQTRVVKAYQSVRRVRSAKETKGGGRGESKEKSEKRPKKETGNLRKI